MLSCEPASPAPSWFTHRAADTGEGGEGQLCLSVHSPAAPEWQSSKGLGLATTLTPHRGSPRQRELTECAPDHKARSWVRRTWGLWLVASLPSVAPNFAKPCSDRSFGAYRALFKPLPRFAWPWSAALCSAEMTWEAQLRSRCKHHRRERSHILGEKGLPVRRWGLDPRGTWLPLLLWLCLMLLAFVFLLNLILKLLRPILKFTSGFCPLGWRVECVFRTKRPLIQEGSPQVCKLRSRLPPCIGKTPWCFPGPGVSWVGLWNSDAWRS